MKSEEQKKAKHREINDRVQGVIDQSGGQGFSPEIRRLRQIYRNRKPTLERPFGI